MDAHRATQAGGGVQEFLRTFLHELCHHLDYEYLKTEDSFHTEGFYKRESSLFHQLMDEPGAVRDS